MSIQHLIKSWIQNLKIKMWIQNLKIKVWSNIYDIYDWKLNNFFDYSEMRKAEFQTS